MDPSEAIERIIDKIGLHDFLVLTAQVCRDKGEHIAANWQDMELARRWDRAAESIDRVAYAKAIKAVP